MHLGGTCERDAVDRVGRPGPGAGTQVLTGSVELGLCPGEHRD